MEILEQNIKNESKIRTHMICLFILPINNIMFSLMLFYLLIPLYFFFQAKCCYCTSLSISMWNFKKFHHDTIITPRKLIII